MTSPLPSAEPGGFLQPMLPSPPHSTIGLPSTTTSTLPHPRSSPLKPGSAKESSFINYVDQKFLGISRRYEKRFNAILEDQSLADHDGRGYETFSDVAKDLETLADVVWVSSTPSLQTPYFLTIALAVSSYLSSFPFSPPPTFQLLRKLDLTFSSLLRGVDIQTGVSLPGFQSGRGRFTITEKVRMRGIVERTRVAVVEVAEKGEYMMDFTNEVEYSTDTEDDFITDDDEPRKGSRDEGGHRKWEMEVARVYERTIVELGNSLDFPGAIGFD